MASYQTTSIPTKHHNNNHFNTKSTITTTKRKLHFYWANNGLFWNYGFWIKWCHDDIIIFKFLQDTLKQKHSICNPIKLPCQRSYPWLFFSHDELLENKPSHKNWRQVSRVKCSFSPPFQPNFSDFLLTT